MEAFGRFWKVRDIVDTGARIFCQWLTLERVGEEPAARGKEASVRIVGRFDQTGGTRSYYL